MGHPVNFNLIFLSQIEWLHERCEIQSLIPEVAERCHGQPTLGVVSPAFASLQAKIFDVNHKVRGKLRDSNCCQRSLKVGKTLVLLTLNIACILKDISIRVPHTHIVSNYAPIGQNGPILGQSEYPFSVKVICCV